jgi:hypothetical protein
MKHVRDELIFLAHFTLIYAVTTLIATWVLKMPEDSWLFSIKNYIAGIALLLFYIKSDLSSLISFLPVKKERRVEVRYPSKLGVILSPLHSALRIPVHAINESAYGIRVVAESTIKGIVKKKQLFKIYIRSNSEIYQVVWTKEIIGQYHIGLLKVS